MKHLPLFLVFSLLFLTSCLEKSTKKSSNLNCSTGSNYWSVPGCPGYTGNPLSTGGTTGGTTQCSGTNYYYYPGCPGYCSQNPTNPACGTSTGGTTGGTTTNPYPNYPSNNVTPNWGVKYPGGVPAGSCTPAYSPSGISYTPYETRKATMTIVGKTWYNPADPVAPNYMNTSSLLRSVTGARQLFSTDSVLKVRFKVVQQPESSSASPYCYGRQTGSSIAGYHKLQFNVQLVGMRANGTTDSEPIGTYTVGVNSCTPAIDLSSYASTYPGGIYLIVQSAKGNQAYFPNNYDSYGFRDVDSFVDIRSQDCWVLDVEVAADGTKTFD
ncbi:MAG: hypothetical protein ACLGHN_08345 [Bacteriovoracia bacterium]